MTRTFRLALTAVLSVAVVIPAFAQDNFPDVPDNHWAYEALARMKREGLLVGYPDGLFRGSRPATRYEMAVAIHATYSHLKNLIEGLQSQIDAIKAGMGGDTGMGELENLKQALTALQNDVAQLKAQDIADLRRMATTFERELAALGVDVQEMKRTLGELADRVTNLENRLPVDISGDLNLLLLGGYGDDDFGGLAGLTVTGRPTGVFDDGAFGAGATRDLQIFHEAALTLTGARKTGPRWKATFVFGNTLQDSFDSFDLDRRGIAFGGGGAAFGTQSTIPVGAPYDEGSSDFWIQNLSVAFDTSLLGLDMAIEAGRVDYKVSPYVFQRPDTTPYYANERWDNGAWTFDGAIIGMNFGTAKWNIFGGRTGNFTNNAVSTVDGTPFQPLYAGNDVMFPVTGRPIGLGAYLPIDQFLGTSVSLPIFDQGSLNLAYLWLDSNTSVTTSGGSANRVTVLGGDAKFNFGQFTVDAGYSQSNLQYNDDDRVDEDNAAWYGALGLRGNRWSASAGWRHIEPNFGAPGDWGRIGVWWNPTDIEGFYGEVNYDLTRDIRLFAQGQSYDGVDDDTVGNGILTEDDSVTSWRAGMAYRMAGDYDFTLGYEEVRWNLENSRLAGTGNGDVIERWYNIGFGWNVSDNAKLRFLWQISDYKALEVPSFAVFGDAAARGGLITSQLSVRF